MDEQMLFQTIDGAIQLGISRGIEAALEAQPTRRDQLAMAALTGLCSQRSAIHDGGPLQKRRAELAYTYADAMEEASKQGPTE